MNIKDFFDTLLNELKTNPKLQGYYRFLQSEKLFEFRKSYYLQRLEYINRQITKSNAKVWDVGCGYGTTAIFLSINGHKVTGNTLEYYFDEIPARLEFWKDKGQLDSLKLDYANLFDSPPKETFDYIIVQDTLHHLEPIDDAIRILKDCLLPDGKIIVVDENGKNIIQRLKLFKQRGNKRIVEIYDEKLKKNIQLGNENIRSIRHWQKLFNKASLNIDLNTIEYNRLYPPFFYSNNSAQTEKLRIKEQKLVKRKLLRNYFYFGLSFVAGKE